MICMESGRPDRVNPMQIDKAGTEVTLNGTVTSGLSKVQFAAASAINGAGP